MTSTDSPPARRKSPLSDQEISIAILDELFERKRRNEKPPRVHRLCSISGIPTQKDQRVKEILDYWCDQGKVKPVEIEGGTGYELTDNGWTYWRDHGVALRLLRGPRKKRF